MYLKVGSYQFDSNAVGITTNTDLNLNGYGAPLSYTTRMAVEGYLSGSTQAGISTACDALEAALRVKFPDIIFYHDDATESSLQLKNSGSISGVRITSGPNFLEYRGADHVTHKRFAFSAEAEYPITNDRAILTKFSESLEFSGGGPMYVVKAAKFGPAQRQQVYQSTPYVVVQSGESVGFSAYPPNPRIIWPARLKMTPNIKLMGPTRRGPGTTQTNYREWGKQWSVIYESESPLIGYPTLWT